MTAVELILIAIGLSMDAFAVALCRGLKLRSFEPKPVLSLALCFGFFQALMPLLGYFVGLQFEFYIKNYDHWIAFCLLAFIGVKMFMESFKEEEIKAELTIPELLILGIATSIDALAVGISFAVLEDIDIVFSVTAIGIVTFVLSFAAASLGRYLGGKYKSKAEKVGGIILFAIGLKILLEHLGVF